MSINSRKSAIALPAMVIFVYGTVASLLGSLLPTLSAHFHLSPEQNGYIAALQAVGLAFATLLAGPLMDSKGIKVALCAGLSLMLLALLGPIVPRARCRATVLGRHRSANHRGEPSVTENQSRRGNLSTVGRQCESNR
jgi:MFS family permease